MKMQEASVLTDCLESLKHAAECYQRAAFECDSDDLRDLLQDIMYDRCEQQAAVFNLMHQMGLYRTKTADASRVDQLLQHVSQGAEGMDQFHDQSEGTSLPHE